MRPFEVPCSQANQAKGRAFLAPTSLAMPERSDSEDVTVRLGHELLSKRKQRLCVTVVSDHSEQTTAISMVLLNRTQELLRNKEAVIHASLAEASKRVTHLI